MTDFVSDELKARAIIRGRTPVFRAEDAIHVLREGKSANRILLGMDSFTISPGVTQPHLDHSPDYSNHAGATTAVYDEAIRFIEDRKPLELFWEIIFKA